MPLIILAGKHYFLDWQVSIEQDSVETKAHENLSSFINLSKNMYIVSCTLKFESASFW